MNSGRGELIVGSCRGRIRGLRTEIMQNFAALVVGLVSYSVAGTERKKVSDGGEGREHTAFSS